MGLSLTHRNWGSLDSTVGRWVFFPSGCTDFRLGVVPLPTRPQDTAVTASVQRFPEIGTEFQQTLRVLHSSLLQPLEARQQTPFQRPSWLTPCLLGLWQERKA